MIAQRSILGTYIAMLVTMAWVLPPVLIAEDKTIDEPVPAPTHQVGGQPWTHKISEMLPGTQIPA